MFSGQIAQALLMANETNVSLPIDDQEKNDKKEYDKCMAELRVNRFDVRINEAFVLSRQFCWFSLASICLIGLNDLIVFCLSLCSEVQISVWKSTFANSSDVDIQPHYTRMRILIRTCSIVNIVALFGHLLCTLGLSGSMRLWR